MVDSPRVLSFIPTYMNMSYDQLARLLDPSGQSNRRHAKTRTPGNSFPTDIKTSV